MVIAFVRTGITILAILIAAALFVILWFGLTLWRMGYIGARYKRFERRDR